MGGQNSGRVDAKRGGIFESFVQILVREERQNGRDHFFVFCYSEFLIKN